MQFHSFVNAYNLHNSRNFFYICGLSLCLHGIFFIHPFCMKPKILLVDDLILNRILLKEILAEIGVDFDEAKNGKQAVDMLIAKDYDLILMDIEMPVMNGIDAVRYIRYRLQSPKCDTPVVAITAHDPHSFFDEFQDAPFNDLVTKPYSVPKIERLIQQLCSSKD